MERSLHSEVIKNMRSCLNSNKDAVCSALNIRQLNDDYKYLIGEGIPYHKLGFKKLEDLIASEPNEFSLSKKGNEWFVRATESNKSSHITDMVLKQKTAKKKPPKFRSYRTPPPRLQQMSKWRAPKSHISKRYEGSKRPQAVIHTQFVNRSPTKKPAVASKVVIPEHSSYPTQVQQTVTTASDQPSYNGRPQVSAATAVKKVDLNHRLNTNRITEKIKTLDSNTSLYGFASSSSNGTSNISNNVSRVSRQESSVIKDNCNPLASTMRRLEIHMLQKGSERDSGISSPTSENSSPLPYKTPEFVRTDNPLTDLKHFAEIHKLGEVAVAIAPFNQRKKKIYSCKIKIGSKYTYNSYPNDFLNPQDAQNFCCEEALKELIPKFKRKSLTIASDKDILDRIPPMLEKHPHGIWASQLELIYSEKYNEVLPDDWLKIVDISPSVQIEKVSNDDHILYHCRPNDILQKGQRRSMPVLVSNVSVPANTIQLGEEGKLVAQVTCVVSAAEIWCQQVETEESEIFSDMMDRLQVYYEEHEGQLVPANITTAGYYIAKCANNYYRVRAVKVSENEIDCFFIDLGVECSCPRTDIFELKREYATAQAQAFVCRLYGLEELYEVSVNSQSVSSLFEKEVFIEMASDATSNDNTSDALPVYMYDCDTGQSINKDLIPQITAETAFPDLSKVVITDVYVAHIEPNGDIYVQVISQGYTNFLKLKQEIQEQIILNPPKEALPKMTDYNSEEKLYFFKQSVDNWSRIKFTKLPKDGRAQIYFVDEGYSREIKVADEQLYPLEALNDIFNKYPPQAVKVKMDLEQVTADFVESATKAIPKRTPLMLRIVRTVQSIPVVKLFRRLEDGALLCINTLLSSDLKLRKQKSDDLKVRLEHMQSMECVPSAGILKCPPLVNIGTPFEVYIPFAINPYNFFIQPFESKQELNEMMRRLQERYRDANEGNLKVENVLKGAIYASKHEDGFWYRTSVIKVIHSRSVSVCYCDFGYYQTLNVKQLMPLDEEFLDLPYQAIKAKLTGVKPIQSKWTMDDCKQFSELIYNKSLYAVIENIGKDDLYESDLVLRIKLINTNLEEDMYIDEELIKRGIAV